MSPVTPLTPEGMKTIILSGRAKFLNRQSWPPVTAETGDAEKIAAQQPNWISGALHGGGAPVRFTVPPPPLAESLYSVYRLCLFLALGRNALSFSISAHTFLYRNSFELNVLNHQDILKTAVSKQCFGIFTAC